MPSSKLIRSIIAEAKGVNNRVGIQCHTIITDTIRVPLVIKDDSSRVIKLAHQNPTAAGVGGNCCLAYDVYMRCC